MTALLEKEYLAKILGFCYQKVNHPADAEDLASDIGIEVLKYIRSGKTVNNFNALVWSISNHTLCKWLRAKKYGSTVYMPGSMPELPAPENVEGEILKREQESLLYREVALLSEKYRSVIVLFYFEGRSCEAIAGILGVKAGTVKWWLHEARNSIKEGIRMNREFGEKSFNPQTLCMSCQNTPGADNEPMSCAKRKIAQNILLAAYRQPVTIQELCVEMGVSAPYMEDEVQYLVDNQLMKAMPGGKYQTDFVILPNNDFQVDHEIYENCFPEYFRRLTELLEAHREQLNTEGFNRAGFTWDRLLWVYIHVMTEFALDKFRMAECGLLQDPDYPQRPNGGYWIALGWYQEEASIREEKMKTWKEYIPSGLVHKIGKTFAQGFYHFWSGIDDSIFFGIPDGVFALCARIIKKEIAPSELTEDEKYLFGIAIEKKLFLRDGEDFRPNFYFADQETGKALRELAEEFYPEARESFSKAWKMVLERYEASVPKHLHWQMGNFLSNYLNLFVTCSLYEGVKEHLLSQPDENNREWLSLYVEGTR